MAFSRNSGDIAEPLASRIRRLLRSWFLSSSLSERIRRIITGTSDAAVA